MREPKWITDAAGNLALFIDYDTFLEQKRLDRVREFANHFGMNGREFVSSYPPNWYGVILVPRVLYTYGCEHSGDVTSPYCPDCGAEVVGWQ